MKVWILLKDESRWLDEEDPSFLSVAIYGVFSSKKMAEDVKRILVECFHKVEEDFKIEEYELDIIHAYNQKYKLSMRRDKDEE